MNRLSLAAVAALLSASVPAGAAVLYVTDGDSSRLALVDTTTGQLISTKHTAQGQYPIAVSSSVWLGNYYGSNASQYALDGTATGVTAPASSVYAVDGTTNGTVNYELGTYAFNSSATVYQANTDWTNPTALFSVGGSSDFVGITYDTAADTLWVSSNSNIYQYSLTGTLISSFAQSGGRGSLAYDGSTDTLWFVVNGSNNILQYSKSGTLLQTETILGLSSNNWGAEFAIGGASDVPEPASWALIIVGLGSVGGVLRRSRKVSVSFQ